MKNALKPSLILQERAAINRALRYVVSDLKRLISYSPEEFRERKDDTASIDVRLCIDLNASGGIDWIIRTGFVDFDPYHSAVCAASTVSEDTELENLLEELIGAAVDAAAEQEELES